MNTYIRLINSIPQIPVELETQLLDYANKMQKSAAEGTPRDYKLQFLTNPDNPAMQFKYQVFRDIAAAEEQGIPLLGFEKKKGAAGVANFGEGYFQTTHQYIKFDELPDVKEWIKENIPFKFTDSKFQIIHGGNVLLPHVDLLQEQVLKYIVEPGGDNVKTAHYVPKLEFAQHAIFPSLAFPYSRLDEVGSVVIPPRAWHTLDVKTIHGVSGLETRRVCLSFKLN